MQERWPSSTTESFSIEVAGHRHRGQRVILTVSDTEIRQEVRYGWLRKVDPDVYRLGEGDFMRSIAKEILWRLVMESTGGTRTPAKVEPRPPRRPRRRGSEE
jgi:hypothetical protein